MSLLLWIVVAAGLGCLVGWTLRKRKDEARRRAIESYYDEAVKVAERARDRARQQAQEMEERWRTVRTAHAQCGARNAAGELEAELGHLRGTLDEREAVVAQLRAEIDALHSHHGGAGNNGAPPWLLTSAEGDKDNLQAIRGLGPVLERGLNELGIFHFRQLARMTAADVAWIAPRIHVFPGRIARDDWPGQARQMHQRKYGERL